MAAVVGRAALIGAQYAPQALSSAKNISLEALGYDFVGLTVKLVIYYLVALMFAKYLELVAGGANLLKNFLALLGFQVPLFVPQAVLDFWQNGYMGVKFWDVVKTISLALVFWEYSNYRRAQLQLGREPSPVTEGIFWLLMGFIAMITFPELVQRLRDVVAMTTPAPSDVQPGTGGFTF